MRRPGSFVASNRAAVGGQGGTPAKKRKFISAAIRGKLELNNNKELEKVVAALIREATGYVKTDYVFNAKGKKVPVKTEVPPQRWAIELLLDRFEGKVSDKLEVEDKTPGGMGAARQGFTIAFVKSAEDAKSLVAAQAAAGGAGVQIDLTAEDAEVVPE